MSGAKEWSHAEQFCVLKGFRHWERYGFNGIHLDVVQPYEAPDLRIRWLADEHQALNDGVASYYLNHINFNKDLSWSIDGTPELTEDNYDLWAVAIHEMGHALALEHECVESQDAVMASRPMSKGHAPHRLHCDDTKCFFGLYPPWHAYESITESSWKDTRWSHVIMDGAAWDFVLRYQSSSGRATVNRVNNMSGEPFGSSMWTGTLEKGFTTLVAWPWRQGKRAFLAYRRGGTTGINVHYGLVRARLGVKTLWTRKWKRDWDQWVSFVGKRGTYVLAYRARDGRLGVSRVGASGPAFQFAKTIPAGFTHLLRLRYRENKDRPSILLYDSNTGRHGVFKINERASGGKFVSSRWQLDVGLTHFVRSDWLPPSHVLGIDRTGGQLRMYVVGGKPCTVWTSTLSGVRPTSVLNLGYDKVLMYDTGAGEGTVTRIGVRPGGW